MEMDNERDSMEVCKNCGKPVMQGELYCSQCVIEHAEEDIPEIEEALTLEGPKKSRFMLIVKCAVLLIRPPALYGIYREDPGNCMPL